MGADQNVEHIDNAGLQACTDEWERCGGDEVEGCHDEWLACVDNLKHPMNLQFETIDER